MRNALAGLILMVGLVAPGMAQVQRLLPANGKIGELVGQQHQHPVVQIDRKLLRLAPGGVILDQNNRFILPVYLPARAEVLYVLDRQGDVTRIVILTPQELARLRQAGAR
ncbi:MAG: hypothetical protein HY322_03355 [Betaproteobacteria bacterium]|nr:hypothetical protein [Betaproteobacteria bacterium]